MSNKKSASKKGKPSKNTEADDDWDAILQEASSANASEKLQSPVEPAGVAAAAAAPAAAVESSAQV